MFPSNLFFWPHVYNAAVKAATNLSGRKVGAKAAGKAASIELARAGARFG